MAELVNLQKGTRERVPDTEVGEALRSGSYTFAKDEQVSVLDPDGKLGVTDGQTAYELLSDEYSGYQYKDAEEYEYEKKALEYNTIPQEIITGAEGALRGATVGLSDLALTKSGLVDEESLKMRQEVNPFISGAGELTGALAPLPTKAPALLKGLGAPTRAIDKLGRRTEKIARGLTKSRAPKTLSEAAAIGSRGAIEGAVYSGASNLSEQALGDPQFNGEIFASAVTDGLVFGGGAGSVLGAAPRAAEIAVRKIKQKVGKDIAKEVGALTDDVANPMNVSTKDLKVKETPEINGGTSIEIDQDFQTGSYSYNDGKKKIDLNPDDLPENIIVPSDQDQLNQIGSFIGVTDLAERYSTKYKPGEMTFRDFLTMEIEDVTLEGKKKALGSVAPAKERLVKASRGAKRLQDKNLDLKRRLANGDMTARKPFETNKKKLNNLLKGYRNAKKGYEDAIKKAVPANKEQVAEKLKVVDDLFNTANGIFDGKKLYIFKPQVLDGALMGGKRIEKYAKDLKGLSRSQQAALREVGAKKSDIKLDNAAKQAELADFIKENFYQNYDRKVLNHKVFTSLDDLYTNINQRKKVAVDGMDNAITRATNYLVQTGQNTGVTGKKIADFVNREFVNPLRNKNKTNFKPGFEREGAEFLRYANNMLKYTRQEFPDGSLRQAVLTPEELRAQKSMLQKKAQQFKRSGDVLRQDFYNSMAFKLDEFIVDSINKFDDTGEIIQMYQKGKKDYHLSTKALKMIEGKVDAEAVKNKSIGAFGFGDTSYALTGAGVGGPIGAMTALAVKKFGDEYGNSVSILYGDKLDALKESIGKAAKRSVGKFVKNDYPVVRAATVIQGQYTDKEYQRDLKRFEGGEMNPDVLSEQFRVNNDGMVAGMPETSLAAQETLINAQSFLVDKFPKSRYEAPGHEFTPTQRDLMKFDRYRRAVATPKTFFRQLENGYVSAETVEATKFVYPQVFAMAQEEFLNQAATRKLSYPQRQLAKKVFGIEMNYYQNPKVNQMMTIFNEGQRKYMPEDEFSAGEQSKVGKQNQAESSRTQAQDMME